MRILFAAILYCLSQTAQGSDLRLKFGAGFHSDRTIQWQNFSAGTSNENLKLTSEDYGTPLWLGLSYSPKNSFGIEGGFNYLPERVFSQSTTSSNPAFFYPTITMGILVAETTALYRWENFYLGLGLNYSKPNTNNSEAGSNIKFRGGLGAQAGIGFYISDKAQLSLYRKAINVKVSNLTTGETKTNGLLRGYEVGLNYLF